MRVTLVTMMMMMMMVMVMVMMTMMMMMMGDYPFGVSNSRGYVAAASTAPTSVQWSEKPPPINIIAIIITIESRRSKGPQH